MKTSFRRVFCILLALCIFTVAVAGLAACNDNESHDDYKGEFKLPVGLKPDLKNRIAASDLDIINGALAEGADAATKKEAALRVYDIANSSRIEDGTSLAVQDSKMGIMGLLDKVKPTTTLASTSATVTMHGFTLKKGGDWYGEFVAQVDKDSGYMAELMTMFSTMLKINYHRESAPDDYYFNIIKSSSIEADCGISRFPYSSYKITKEADVFDLEGFKNATNILDAPNEIYNMDFCEEILADDVTIEHKDGVYKVHFTVDPNADGELLKQWFRMPQKDMKEGGQEIKSYLRYICEFEVWDNGYAKSYYAEYVRDAGMGSGITIDRFNYIWNEKEIMDIISDDYRLDKLDNESKNKLHNIEDYIDLYTSAGTVKAKMPTLYIVLIVLGCVAFAAIVAVIVVEILVRKGKLPKLAAKREAKKQKRLAKKTENKGAAPKTDGEEALKTTAEIENADGAHLDETSSETDQDEQ